MLPFYQQPELRYGWWERSGKMHVLHSILRLWSKQGHRVLLFTQSCQMMCILEKFLMDEGYSYLKMDGLVQYTLYFSLGKKGGWRDDTLRRKKKLSYTKYSIYK